MASLTCPNCGKDNPDFLDDCQFCQTPLRREATLNTGEGPTKKSTGELEGVLPDWLKEARQQARDSAEEEAAKEATKPKIQKEEPLDLLAGLAFQAASEEDEVPDWLSAINPVQDKKTTSSAQPAEEDQSSDFFAQFEKSKQSFDTSPTVPMSGDLGQAEDLPWMSGNAEGSQKDELKDWFSQTSAQPDEPFTFDSGEPPASRMSSFDAPVSQEPAAPEQPEDLGWLRELEASTKQQPAEQPPEDTGWMSNLESGAQAQDDLNWLNNLGGTPAASSERESQAEDLSWLNSLGGTPLPEEPAASSKEDDLSWLNNLGGTPLASEPTSSQPESAAEDLGWLKNLEGTPAPAEPAKEDDLSWLKNFGETPAEPVSPQSAQSADDMTWLNNLGGTPAPEAAGPAPAQEDLDWLNSLSGTPTTEPQTPQPAPTADDLSWLKDLGGTPAPTIGESSASQEDLNWLDNLGGAPAMPSSEPSPLAQPEVPDWLKDMEAQQSIEAAHPPQFSPKNTAPLSQDAMQEIPDWLKSATEAAASTSMPPLGAAAEDRKSKQAADQQKSDAVSGLPFRSETSERPQETPAPTGEDVFSVPTDSSLENQDVDALFAVDMPDWLSQPESGVSEASAQMEALSSASGSADELAPVDLPSWVQAMRPVEAAIGEAGAVSADQTLEREGPLAGLRGVIPFAPIGSAQRPRAISLKLQATAEQQAGAALVEQIIASEATANPLRVSPFVSSQRALRWGLTAVILVALSLMIGLGTQMLPISAALPAEVSNVSNAIVSLPEGAPVLVVMDYEPSLAGEMEAASGPLLDQLVVLRKPIFTFLATSPNGTGLVDRLLANTKIKSPASEGGLGYQSEVQYFNAGYLPGGLAGVRGFTEAPQTVSPAVRVNRFSEFAAVILITDHAESGLVWIEQVTLAKQSDPLLASQQFLVVASAQAGPMLRPYVSSNQVAGMISSIADAARYEFVNNSRPGIVRTYWDAFGVGLFLAIGSIVIGSLWSLFTGIRARRAEAEQG